MARNPRHPSGPAKATPVALPPEHREALEKYAQERHMSLGEVVSRLMERAGIVEPKDRSVAEHSEAVARITGGPLEDGSRRPLNESAARSLHPSTKPRPTSSDAAKANVVPIVKKGKT
jgi:hypothetical protein